jgi:hypothetical protein
LDGCDSVEVRDVNVLSLIITTGLGDDSVYVGREECGNYFAENLIVRTDGGDDWVEIGDQSYDLAATTEDGGEDQSHVGNDLIVETGDGTDYIKVFNYCIGEDVVINSGAGDDSSCDTGDYESETFDSKNGDGGVHLCELKIGRHLTVLLGDGADSASINDVCVEGNASIDAGAGDDGGGFEYGDVSVQNGSGSDAGVSIRDLFVRQNFFLFLGTGHDDASLCDVEVCGNAYIYGGADCDRVELDEVDVHNNLFVFMGGGDDKLEIDCSSAEIARLYGDGGYDEYCEGSNSFGQQFVYSFENWTV